MRYDAAGRSNSFRFTYVVETDARWKGKIQDAEFFIDLRDAQNPEIFQVLPTSPNPDGEYLFPEGAQISFEKNVYHLKFQNLEPDFNISVDGQPWLSLWDKIIRIVQSWMESI
jgi:hypothetical protein